MEAIGAFFTSGGWDTTYPSKREKVVFAWIGFALLGGAAWAWLAGDQMLAWWIGGTALFILLVLVAHSAYEKWF